MGSTDALVAVVVVITAQTIPHDASLILRQDPNGIDGQSASLRMPCQVGEKAGANGVKPMQFLAQMNPRFISMHQFASEQCLLDLLHGDSQSLGGFLDPTEQRPL